MRKKVVIIDLDTRQWELNELRLPLENHYKNPYILFPRQYKEATSKKAYKDSLRDLDKLIAGLQKYREEMSKNAVVVVNLHKSDGNKKETTT